MSIVEKIRVLSNKEGMSLPDLEIKLGLGNGTISRWKNSSPNSDKITKVADYFNVSVDYLLGRETNDIESDAVKKVKILTRRTEEYLTSEEQENLIKHYEDSINLYLKAKGINIDK